MSLESAKKFVEKIKTDEEFLGRLSNAESRTARRSIVEKAGFEFSEEEFETARTQAGIDAQTAVGPGGCWLNCQLIGPECGEGRSSCWLKCQLIGPECGET